MRKVAIAIIMIMMMSTIATAIVTDDVIVDYDGGGGGGPAPPQEVPPSAAPQGPVDPWAPTAGTKDTTKDSGTAGRDTTYYNPATGKATVVKADEKPPLGYTLKLEDSSAAAMNNVVNSYGKPTGKTKNADGSWTYTFKPAIDDTDTGIIEDYRHTTTATVTVNSDGSTTTTTKIEHSVCGKGLTSCDGKYTVENVEGGSVTTGAYKNADGTPALDSKQNPITGVTSKEIITYQVSADGKTVTPVASRETIYKVDPKTGTYSTSEMKVYTYDKGAKSDKPVYAIDAKGNTQYYDAQGNKVGSLEEACKGRCTEEQKKEASKQIDRANVAYVNSGAAGWNAFKILGTARVMGRFMRAYDEYSGLRQYSAIGLGSYEAQVQERKMKIQQEFCLASGITNCIVSTICGKRYPIKSDNVVAGRGPGGQFVTSAVLNGERSLAIEIEGLTRQQLMDMFGNQTVIAGRLINLTDPKFDPKVLGKMKLRMYHVQYQITNNVKSGKEMHYNIEFRKGTQASNSSYGPVVKQAKWYNPDKGLEFQKSAKEDLYKFSATEYSDVCLTFEPGLPSGPPGGNIPGIGLARVVDHLCVPFKEYAGGPTEITAKGTVGEGTSGAAAPAAGAAPGALI